MLSAPLLEASQRFSLKYGMTPREAEIFNFLLEGMVPEDIAVRLGLKVNTVRNHVKSLLRAGQAKSISSLLAKFIREVVPSPPKPPQT